MSEATDRHIVSFAQDIIYDVTCCKVETPTRVCLAVLLKSRSCPVELVKVRQTLSIVCDSLDIPNGLLLDVENFLCPVYAFPSIGDIKEGPFLLFCISKNIQCHQLPATKDALQKHFQIVNFQAAVWKRTCQWIFGLP